jgi:hypothetical protein
VVPEPYPGRGSRFGAFWHTLMGNSDVEGHDLSALTYDFNWASAYQIYMGRDGEFSSNTIRESEDFVIVYTRPFPHPMMVATYDRRFFVTNQGYIGFAPIWARAGDAIRLLFGASVPFILRKLEDHYVLIGECYCHSIMTGK